MAFGTWPADMLEPDCIGFAQFFPSPAMELVSLGIGVILTRDPASPGNGQRLLSADDHHAVDRLLVAELRQPGGRRRTSVERTLG